MRYAIISDVHANARALEAVMRRCESLCVERILCLGDIVGYYAEPSECIRRIRESGIACVAGNHDQAACGAKPFSHAGPTAQRAIDWTRKQISRHDKQYLASLPVLKVETEYSMVHGALHPKPNVWLHLSTPQRVAHSLDRLASGFPGPKLCFFGHTHRQAIYRQQRTATELTAMGRVVLDSRAHYLINPGSVGQPRDGGRRAGFIVYESDENAVEFHREQYDPRRCWSLAKRHGLLPPKTATADRSSSTRTMARQSCSPSLTMWSLMVGLKQRFRRAFD